MTTPEVDAFRVGNLAQHVTTTIADYREAIAHHLRTQTPTSKAALAVARIQWEAIQGSWMILTGCRADQVEAQAEATNGLAHSTPWVTT